MITIRTYCSCNVRKIRSGQVIFLCTFLCLLSFSLSSPAIFFFLIIKRKEKLYINDNKTLKPSEFYYTCIQIPSFWALGYDVRGEGKRFWRTFPLRIPLKLWIDDLLVGWESKSMKFRLLFVNLLLIFQNFSLKSPGFSDEFTRKE